MDHGSLNEQLNLTAGQSKQCFNITITDDDVVEEDEVFWISITRIRNAAGQYKRHPYRRRANIFIIDDDNCK